MNLSLLVRALCAATVITCATAVAQYSVSSTPGSSVIPSGAPGNTGGGGTWPSAFPPAAATQSMILATPVPASATNIKRVILHSLYHTWVGDLQIVLNDPNGMRYNLVHRVGSVGNAVGYSANYGTSGTTGANYTIVDPSDPSINQSWPTTSPGTTVYLAAGIYPQEYGALWGGGWVDGTQFVQNDNLSTIPATPGHWTMTIYDWAGGDTGTISHFTMEGDAGPVAPSSYCTAGTSTNGCVPSISANSQPNTTFSGTCVITIANVEGQKSGIVFYGINNSGFVPTPWGIGSTSFLCVKAPTQRMTTQSSGGTTNTCTGTLVQDLYTFLMVNPTSLGMPLMAGNKIYAQGWYRDPPAVKTTNLSNALEMTVQ
jgi:subtilisin-like proprotein convertase family protein